MSKTRAAGGAPWVIVLAGGKGRRMAPTVRDWLGRDATRPKQYCTFVGRRTMFEHTLDRMSCITMADRIVSVIGRGHREFITRDVPGLLLEQPADCGTGAGVFLPLAHVIERDPEATVLLTPSDQFVHPDVLFQQYATLASVLAQQHPDHVVLLGARPDHAETDYGWIEPGPTFGMGADGPRAGVALETRSFHEKPSEAEAGRLFRSGGLWNTFVLAAKVKTLWSLGWKFVPQVITRLDTWRQVLHAIRCNRCPPEHGSLALAHAYQSMPRADFSRDILQNATDSILVLPLEGVRWSDWGRPQRIVDSLASLGQRPAFSFPRESAAAPGHSRAS